MSANSKLDVDRHGTSSASDAIAVINENCDKLSCLTSAETKQTLDLIRLVQACRSGTDDSSGRRSTCSFSTDGTFVLAGDDVEKLIAPQSELSRLLRRVIDFPIGFISFHRRSKNFNLAALGFTGHSLNHRDRFPPPCMPPCAIPHAR